MDNFWEVIWTAVVVFALIAYLILLISIVSDLFRDPYLSGWSKAFWVIFLVWVPYIAAFAYLIARGGGLADRQAQAARHNQHSAAHVHDYSTPATEIAKARELLDSGAITAGEFDSLKAKAMAW
jgi:hypothetical protein